jgi:hypothetical protein
MDTIIAPFMRDLSNLVALSARRFSPEGDGRFAAGRFLAVKAVTDGDEGGIPTGVGARLQSSCRHRNSCLACIPASRATSEATTPGSSAAAMIRSFSARDHRRRRCTEVITSTGPLGSRVGSTLSMTGPLHFPLLPNWRGAAISEGHIRTSAVIFLAPSAADYVPIGSGLRMIPAKITSHAVLAR